LLYVSLSSLFSPQAGPEMKMVRKLSADYKWESSDKEADVLQKAMSEGGALEGGVTKGTGGSAAPRNTFTI